MCGRCGRKLKVHYQGRRGHKSPAYHCPASILVENRGEWCVRVGGGQIDQAVTGTLLAALTPAGVKAALQAAEALEQDHDAALKQWRLQLERAKYHADRAERRYRQVEPEHRLVARGLERDWENALGELAKAEAELALREQQRPRTLTAHERERLLALGADLGRVWSAPTTTDRDRKQLLRCLIEEVIITLKREERRALLTIRWKGGAITELAVTLPKPQPAVRTDEDTIELIRRLAAHYDDGRIAGILNRQGRRSATGERFTAIIVGGLRRYRQIPAYKPPTEPLDGELLPVGKAADELGVAASTIFRWLQAGFIRGEQDTPGAPWRIRVNDQLRSLFVEARATRLRSDRRRDADPRRLPPNRVAACQARRAASPPRPQRTPKRPANTDPTSRNQPVRHHPHERAGSVTMAPTPRPSRRRAPTGAWGSCLGNLEDRCDRVMAAAAGAKP